MAGFPSLDDLKKHLNITRSTDDDELLLMLDAANELVGSIVGPFDAATVTERVPVVGSAVLLSRVPAGSVVLTDPAGSEVTGGTVSAAARVVYDVLTGYGSVTAEYDTGGTDVPAAVGLATLIIAGHLWETQRGAAPVGPLAAADDTSLLAPGVGYAIPNRAKELLEPFIGSAQIA